MKSLIFSVLFFYQVEKNKCEYHLTTNDEYFACQEFTRFCKDLEDKQEKLLVNGVRIHSDYRYRVGLGLVNGYFHVFKLKISCENRKHRLTL